MAIIMQPAQLLQSFGTIATSAADAAAEGINKSVQADSNSVNTALKLFGGFDRSEFENINRSAPNLLVPAVRPPASYEGPAEYFKPLSNTLAGQDLLVPSKELLQQLENPQFRMTDGLSGFSDNRITQTLAQKGMIINSKPGGDVSLGGLNETGIIIIDNKPAEPGDMASSLDSFGKLYMMENTVEKQLQLHEQLDIGAFWNFSGAKQNPRLDRGLKGIPDAQIATQTNHEMLNLWEYAMTGIPKTIGEFFQILDTINVKVQGILDQTDDPKIKEVCLGFQLQLKQLKGIFQHASKQSALPPAMLNYLEPIRASMRTLIYWADKIG